VLKSGVWQGAVSSKCTLLHVKTVLSGAQPTLIYPTIAEHFKTWFELASVSQFDGQGDHHTPKPASGIDETAVAQAQTDWRRRILRAFVGRDLPPVSRA
jgi:hypothetical protein